MFATPFDLTISSNRLRLENRKSGATLECEANPPFSSVHLLIADSAAFSALAARMIREMEGRRRFFLLANVRVHFTDEPGQHREVELIREMLTNIGFLRVEIED